MTRVLDKNLNNVYELRDSSNDEDFQSIDKSTIKKAYNNLIKHSVFDKEIARNDFLTIIKYNILYFYGRYTTVITNCYEFVRSMMMDFDKYLNYEKFKVAGIYYNPYLSIFLYKFLENNNIEYKFRDIDVPFTDSFKINSCIDFAMDNTRYCNAFNFIVIMEIDGIKKYYLITTFACDGYDYKIPKIINITEKQYNSFVDYINKHEELQIPEINSENGAYYLNELPEETKEK